MDLHDCTLHFTPGTEIQNVKEFPVLDADSLRAACIA